MEEENIDIGIPGENEDSARQEPYRTIKISGMYENWFLDYASYVILERAVPDVKDGLKPVQRRLLHAMKELDDGRYNKVANIIGHTMRYHPHGDASIGDALIQLGQKDLLIDTQGNWGNILTGDSAAAPRYIEARLSKFALDVVFNPKTTNWKLSYDGRNKEPVTLPVKFPLLLAQGVEGIAVGLASKILPHNFNELIDATIAILQEQEFELFPDFPTGGLIDVSRYNDGIRGGKVRVRARIKKIDNKTLGIYEMPFGVTTGNLIDTIIQANDKRKIKIRKIDDNTASEAEIIIHLMPGVSPDQTIDALYAFTSCEVSISPNGCVIQDGKPKFLGVKEMIRISTANALDLLRSELEIHRSELQENWHTSSLEKIFIEERIYRKIENCTTWESVIKTIEKGLEPFASRLLREISAEDILRLTEIKIKRISKYNSFKADEVIKNIEKELAEVKHHLEHLIEFAIEYFRDIQARHGKGRERKTEIRNFDIIEAAKVAVASQKLYINREEGFVGTSLKKDEYICDCSDIDDIIIFKEDGTFRVAKVEAKAFVGKDTVHISVFKKNDDRTIYNIIYRDGKKGIYYTKRFAVVGITREKEYTLTKGAAGSKIIYFTANPNGEAETVKVFLRPKPRLKKTSFEFDFSTLAIKGRNSQGNILTRQPVRQVLKKEEGVSTLGAREIWYDDTVKRLNTEGRGIILGAFQGDDKIFTINSSGHYKLFGQDLSTHFDDDMIIIEKFNPRKIVTAVYFDGASKTYYLKRFPVEVTDKKAKFTNENAETRLLLVTLDWLPRLEIVFAEKKGKRRANEMVIVADFIGEKSYKAKGRRLSDHEIEEIHWLEPLPYDEPVEIFKVVAVGDDAEPEAVKVEENLEEPLEPASGLNQEEEQNEKVPPPKSDDYGMQIKLEFE